MKKRLNIKILNKITIKSIKIKSVYSINEIFNNLEILNHKLLNIYLIKYLIIINNKINIIKLLECKTYLSVNRFNRIEFEFNIDDKFFKFYIFGNMQSCFLDKLLETMKLYEKKIK